MLETGDTDNSGVDVSTSEGGASLGPEQIYAAADEEPSISYEEEYDIGVDEPEPEKVVDESTTEGAAAATDDKAGTAASATANDDEELKGLQENSVGWKKLRGVAEARGKTISDLNNQVSGLQQRLDGSIFNPNVPAEEFDAKAWWDRVGAEFTPYGDKLRDSVWRDHADSLPEDVCASLLMTHVPQLIEHAFGMTWEEMEKLAGGRGNAPGQMKLPDNSQVGPEEFLENFGLDPDDEQHVGLYSVFNNLVGRLEKAEHQLADQGKAQTEEKTTKVEREAGERVQTLHTTLSTARKTVFDEISKAVPKDRAGVIPYIDSAAMQTVASDQNYQVAMKRAESYYKQNTPQLALGEIAKCQAIQAKALQDAATNILGPIWENTKLKNLVNQKQLTRKEIPTGGGGANLGGGGEQPAGDLSDPDSIRARVLARHKANQSHQTT